MKKLFIATLMFVGAMPLGAPPQPNAKKDCQQWQQTKQPSCWYSPTNVCAGVKGEPATARFRIQNQQDRMNACFDENTGESIEQAATIAFQNATVIKDAKNKGWIPAEEAVDAKTRLRALTSRLPITNQSALKERITKDPFLGSRFWDE